MFEIQKIIGDIAGILQFAGISHFVIPHAGVGGGVEAREHIDLIPLLEYTLFFLAGIGTLFGLGTGLCREEIFRAGRSEDRAGQRGSCPRALRRLRVRGLRTICRSGRHQT